MSRLLDNIEELVAVGENFRLYVKGSSMLPLLGYGRDHIILRRTTAEEDIMGRIAMFRGERGNIIVHRVIGLHDGIVTLRGDGNIYQVEQCRREKIVGVVESVIRQNGRCVSCTSSLWRLRERIWLSQPLIVRRYALAIIRRWKRYVKREK